MSTSNIVDGTRIANERKKPQRRRRWARPKQQTSIIDDDFRDNVSLFLREAEDQDAKGQLTEDMRFALFQQVQGYVRHLCFDTDGCRLVQRVLELVWGDAQKALVLELQGYVSAAVADPHGNHVIQKCIELMRNADVHFILHELQDVCSPSELATDRYGCRVFQRMIEHFDPSQLDSFVDGLVENAKELCFDEFGNYVIQTLFENGSIKHKTIISNMLLANVEKVAKDSLAIRVLDKALTYSTLAYDLAKAILDKEGLVVDMATRRSRFSVVAAHQLFKVCKGHRPLKNIFMEQVREVEEAIKFGWIVAIDVKAPSDPPKEEMHLLL